MKSVLKPLLIASILVTTGVGAFSQTPGMGPGHGMGPGGAMMGAAGPMHDGMGHHGMARMDPAMMQARVEKHQAVLKAMLKLTPAQESAWTTFTSAIKPPATSALKRPEPVEIAKLTTPERIDKMKALQTQRQSEMNAAMDKRAEATKAFYAALTPEQQKVFDAATVRYMARGGHMGGQRDGRGPA